MLGGGGQLLLRGKLVVGVVVIGKGGFIAVTDGILSVNCGEKTLFSAQVDTLEAWEFLSLEGVTLTGYDLTEGKERTVMAYYKYFRD